jgi:hypothetical protein
MGDMGDNSRQSPLHIDSIVRQEEEALARSLSGIDSAKVSNITAFPEGVCA